MITVLRLLYMAHPTQSCSQTEMLHKHPLWFKWGEDRFKAHFVWAGLRSSDIHVALPAWQCIPSVSTAGN